jgi:hypothetical protein
MPAKTSAASAICGTHLGLTNADTSIRGRPADERRSTNAVLSAVDSAACSFCSPSLGPTSTIETLAGRIRSSSISMSTNPGWTRLALAAVHCGSVPGPLARTGRLHLHGFEDDERLAALDGIADAHKDASDRRGHGRHQRTVVAVAGARERTRFAQLEHLAVDEDPTDVARGDGPRDRCRGCRIGLFARAVAVTSRA